MDIFTGNIPTMTPEQQELLASKTVFVAGCGGLGGFITEFLVRLGVGGINACDGDVFSASNLNRQLLATSATLGKSKVLTARERALSINPDVRFTAFEEMLTAENAERLLSGCDVAMDALDNAPSRIVLARAAAAAGIPMVHGAVGGRSLQVAVVLPESTFFTQLYTEEAAPDTVSTLSFVPALCAALEVSEALKLLTGAQPSLADRLLIYDLERMSGDTISFE